MPSGKSDDKSRAYRYEERFEDSECPGCPKKVTIYMYTKNPEIIKQLERIGASLVEDETVCPRCGTKAEIGVRFCPNCGFCLGCE
ncbi:MAG: zinc-ribbon domain-containing protein [Nitrososphaerota archaeon]